MIPPGNMTHCGNCKAQTTEVNPVRWRDDLDYFLCASCYDELSWANHDEEQRDRVAR